MSRPAMSFQAALLAGLIAIIINTALLHLAKFIPLEIQGGGLLKLLKMGFGDVLAASPINGIWHYLHMPAPDSEVFKTLFHVGVGLAMALVYAALIEPRLQGPAWLKGLLYALLVWLLNAFVLLPWVGEGVAGTGHLSLAGIAYYAIAHTVFFVLVAPLYAQLRR